MSEWLFWGAVPFLAAAFITDIRHMRIPNALSLAMLGTGLLFQMLFCGWKGLFIAACGAGTGFLVLLILYLIRAVGGGDVKLFAAIGAWIGALPTLQLLVYSVFIGAIIGWIIVLSRRETGKRLRSLLSRSAGMLLHGGQVQLPAAGGDLLRFPFMLAVVPAYICTYIYV
ncbi:A24 family peptidase [Paenibacillus tengchongensis]|uniref:A24 family peptidase n=1 Tax=Paenibacillus tengchongensis TaxID=2608684 RepID=UPI00124F4E6D|nr:A24 family peptidase [Paenibacillus tengchongensis]